jgi:predicted nuclease of predicted toxin-antitoxin system
VKLLVDMNLSPQWVERLTAAGLSAVLWSVAGALLTVDPARTRLTLLPLRSDKP